MSVMILKGYQAQFPLHFPCFTGIFFLFMVLIQRMMIFIGVLSNLLYEETQRAIVFAALDFDVRICPKTMVLCTGCLYSCLLYFLLFLLSCVFWAAATSLLQREAAI